MATEKQIAANRANAKKSTGPKTGRGKANIRFNNLRHGLFAADLVLPNEDQQDFDNLLGELEDEWQPRTYSQRLLVREMARSRWQLLRVDRARNAILIANPDMLENLIALDRLSQHESRLERASFRAYKELDRLKRLRQKQLAEMPSGEESYPYPLPGRASAPRSDRDPWGAVDCPLPTSPSP